MFDNQQYQVNMTDVHEQFKNLYIKEYEILEAWSKELEVFLKDPNITHVIINDEWYVEVNEINSSVVKTSNKPVYWFRIHGLCFSKLRCSEGHHHKIRPIKDVFSITKNISIFDKIMPCDVETFTNAFRETCEELFIDRGNNKEVQLYYYTTFFQDYVLNKYGKIFPEYVHTFVQELDKLDQDRYNEEDFI